MTAVTAVTAMDTMTAMTTVTVMTEAVTVEMSEVVVPGEASLRESRILLTMSFHPAISGS